MLKMINTAYLVGVLTCLVLVPLIVRKRIIAIITQLVVSVIAMLVKPVFMSDLIIRPAKQTVNVL